MRRARAIGWALGALGALSLASACAQIFGNDKTYLETTSAGSSGGGGPGTGTSGSGAASSASTSGVTSGAGGACAAADGGCGPDQTLCAGSCQATCQLASGEGSSTIATTQGVTVSGGYAFWTTSDGNVMKVPAGGGAFTTLATKQSPTAVAADATHLYWVNFSDVASVLRVPIAGGPAETLYDSGGHGVGVAVDATSVYWINGGQVVKAPKAPGTPLTSIVLASGQSATGIAVDTDYVYWANAGTMSKNDASMPTWNKDGAVFKIPLSGGTATPLAANQAQPASVAVDGTSVYWVNRTDGTVMKAPKVPENPLTSTTLATGTKDPRGVAVDCAHVYWTSYGDFDGVDGAVMKVPLGGGAPIMLAAKLLGPTSIAVDATSVYWITNSYGAPSSEALTKAHK